MSQITRFVTSSHQVDFTNYEHTWSDNFADVVTQTDRLIGAHGGFDGYGRDPAPNAVGLVRVTFTLAASAAAAMTAQLDALRAMARWEKGKLYMQPTDPGAAERYCDARLNNIQTASNDRNHTSIWQPVSLVFQASDPHWYDGGNDAWAWGGGTIWGGGLWGGGAISDAVSGTSTDIVIHVSGSVPTKPRLTFTTGVGQTAEDVTIRRIVSAQVVDEVKRVGVMSASQALEFDTRKYSVTLDGSPAYDANVTYLRSRLFILEPGENTIRVLLKNAGDAGTLTIRYLGTYT